jgi:hypothetical protein
MLGIFGGMERWLRERLSRGTSADAGQVGAMAQASRRGVQMPSREVQHAAPPTRRDAMRLSMDEFVVKRKLGPSHFTRRQTPGTRSRRVSMLSKAERAIARARGWIW